MLNCPHVIRSWILSFIAAAIAGGGCLDNPTPKSATETEDTSTEDETRDTSTEDETVDTSAEIVDADGDTEVTTTPPASALTSTLDSERWVIGNDRFEVVLEADTGWLPAELRTFQGSGANLVYGNTTQSSESWLGLSLYDRAHLWADATQLDASDAGGAIVRASKTWAFQGEMSGTTELTVHADGRLVVSWDITVPTTRAPATLVAYTTLDILRFTHVEAGTADSWTLPTGQTPGGGFTFLTTALGDVPYLCARHTATRDVVGFVERGVASLDPLLPRITEHAGGAGTVHSLRLQYDFARDSVPAGTYAGRLLLAVDGTTTCDRVAAQAEAFRAPAALTMSIGALRLDAPGDADADGYVEAGGYYTIASTTRAATLIPARTLPSLTLRLFGTGWSQPTLVAGATTLAHGTDFIAQPAAAGDGGWVVLLRPLSAGAGLSITW
ncbi:MAG: hypothetical protein IT385_18165 [Deltaproteobacteria bacterium]|nr:hypothetical protein [Deltaproteobacteria bacterium]